MGDTTAFVIWELITELLELSWSCSVVRLVNSDRLKLFLEQVGDTCHGLLCQLGTNRGLVWDPQLYIEF